MSKHKDILIYITSALLMLFLIDHWNLDWKVAIIIFLTYLFTKYGDKAQDDGK